MVYVKLRVSAKSSITSFSKKPTASVLILSSAARGFYKKFIIMLSYPFNLLIDKKLTKKEERTR